MHSLNKQLTLMLSLGTILAAATATAQSPASTSAGSGEEIKLEEIVVTAERRSSDVQKTAASISVLSGDDLLQQGKISTRQILEAIAGVNATDTTGMLVAGTDTQGNNISIRGVPANGVPGLLPAVPTTAVYTDGIYEGIGNGYDIDRVEVLRGPQGTLYGRSATAGVVATHTRNPNLNELGLDASAEWGSYSLQHYSAAANLPLANVIAFRFAGDEYKRDGYYSAEGGAVERTSGRAKMLYKPSEDFSLLAGIALEDNTTHTGGTVGNMPAPDTFSYQTVPVLAGKNKFRQYWLNLDWNLGPATLTYLPAFRTWWQDAHVWNVGPGNSDLNQTEKTPLDQFVTHELRLASNADSKIKWLAGVLYYDNRLRNSNNISWLYSGAPLVITDAQRETKDVGGFGEATLPFTAATRMTVGLRYDYTYVNTTETYTTNVNLFCNTPLGLTQCATGTTGPLNSPLAGTPVQYATASLSGNEGTRRFYNLTYRARLEHDLSPKNLVWAMMSTGFIPGDVQMATGANNKPFATPYNEETLTAYEIGSKNRFLDDRLQVNGDVFYYRYGGYQTQITVDPANPGSAISVLVPARMKGVEFDIQYLLTARDKLGLSYAYSDSYFVDPPKVFSDNVVQGHVTGVIPQTVNASYDHTFPFVADSSLVLHLDGRLLSSHDVATVSPAYAALGAESYVHIGQQFVGDVSGTWSSSSHRYSVTGYVRNVTDNRYPVTVRVQAVGTSLSTTGSQYDPRTVGVLFSLHL